MALRRDFQTILEEINEEISSFKNSGEVANYIPELAKIPKEKFGFSVCTIDGQYYSIGESEEPFSIQSISKVFSLTLAMMLEGDELWKRTGREPSGTAFNSLVQLEYEHGIPRNPFINAGALVITDVLISHLIDPKIEILDFLRHITTNQNISFDQKVAKSEASVGFRNKAMGYFMKSFGNIKNNVEEVLDNYFAHCSISMSCKDLAKAGLFLANRGINPLTGEIVLDSRRTKYVNSLMLTCGTYDAVGQFAYQVGLPAKSGVGGGIMAVMPGEFSICVWSPGLDNNGNSLAGIKALDLFTTKTGISIF